MRIFFLFGLVVIKSDSGIRYQHRIDTITIRSSNYFAEIIYETSCLE